VRSPLANVFATRTGMGGFPEGWAPGENYPKVGRVALLSTLSVAT
jgi:glucan biosynthesis protein